MARAATELGAELCHYPGIVALSYRWREAAHPDPQGQLLSELAAPLQWCAAG